MGNQKNCGYAGLRCAHLRPEASAASVSARRRARVSGSFAVLNQTRYSRWQLGASLRKFSVAARFRFSASACLKNAGTGHGFRFALGTGGNVGSVQYDLDVPDFYKGPLVMHGFEERDVGASVSFLRQLLPTTGCA